MAARYNKFSGLNKQVACRCCGKQTHSSIDGNVGISLCRVCYEGAGLENEHNDQGHEVPIAECPVCNGVSCMHEVPAEQG